MIDFPPGFVERARALLGAETDDFLRALAAPAAGLRVNTLRLSPTEFAALSPFALERLRFPPEGFAVSGEGRPGKHPYHAAGLYYLQDPGAMVVAAMVAPRPGERVLDLAAAPGGKATHLGALLAGEGVLVANDVHAGRSRELAGNLERCGVTASVTLNETADRLAERCEGWFDRVLLDAPCSGESMFHKSEAARQDWSPAAVLGCARRQGDLIGEAARLVRPGGTLVYSTCTFSPEENEEVVGAFLERAADFEPAPLPEVPGASPALGLPHAVRLWPHRVPGAGHFVAALRRGGASGGPAAPGAPRAGSSGTEKARDEGGVPAPARRLFEEWAGDHLRRGFAEERMVLRGSALHLLPEEAPPLKGLRVVQGGWWLGTVEKGRFEPSHSLAMGLRAEEAARTVDLDPEDPAALAYLRGETLSSPGEPGWVLVTVRGYPLGWGKRVGATVKNHYPKGLRRR